MPNSSTRVVVDVGTVIAETYRIEALIGRGGMGSVFVATHARLPGKQVAIKLLHADLQDADVIARFKREAEIASRLNHPNIVGVHDFNVLPDGTPYLVLEYLAGESLSSRLHAGPLPLDAVFSIARQVGSALAAAHREGIVHRDLKPANIFLVPTEVDGKVVEVAKVLDFGISKMRGSTTVKTQESTLLGTPQYMAPEQAKGEHANVDQRTDIFALGSIIYEMLAGHPAFSGENIPEVCFKVVYEQPTPLRDEAPTIPDAVVETVARAMAKLRDERFPSVDVFIEELTGRKLAAVPSRSGISVPPADGPATGEDAFANTMASGEFGIAASTPRPRLPTPIPAPEETPPPVNPGAATMQSVPPPVEGAAAPAPPVIPPRRSLGPMIGLAFASALVGALVIYFATRDAGAPDNPPPDAAPIAQVVPVGADATRADHEPDAAPVSPPDTTPDATLAEPDATLAEPDAGPAIADAAVARPPRDAGRPPPDPGIGNDNAGPRGPTLARAAAAAAAKDWDLAWRLATEVTFSDDARPMQRIRARSIRAIAHCVHKFNEEGAGLDLKAIPSNFRALRKQVLAACHRTGYLMQTAE